MHLSSLGAAGRPFAAVVGALALVATACQPAPATAPAATAPPAAPAGKPAAGASPAASPAAVKATTAAAGTPKRGGTLTVGLDSDPGHLDPMQSAFLVDRQVHYNLYDSLVAIDPGGKIVPSLAERWDISPDGKAYTFFLRRGVTFHDGTDFNAEAVKFTLERNLKEETSRRKSEIVGLEAVTVVDPHTVKLELKEPFAPLLASLVDRAGMIVSPTAVQKGGKDFTRNPVGAGTGPFKFVEWVKDDHLTLEANKAYWRRDAAGTPLPYADKLVYKPIRDETVMLTNVKTGDVTVTFVAPPKDVASLKQSTEVVYKQVPGLSFFDIELFTGAPPFDNKALRQAVAYAIDREEILKTVFFGVGSVGYGPIAPPHAAFDPSLKPYTYDAAKVKQKLAEGGKPEGLQFTMQVSSGSPLNIQLAQLMKAQMAKAGITMEITQLEFAKVVENQQKGQFQASLIGWSGRIDPDGNMFAFLTTGGSFNDPKYSNPRVDELMQRSRRLTNEQERTKVLREAERLAVEDAAFVWYRHGVSTAVMQPKVQGLELYPDQILRFASVWLK